MVRLRCIEPTKATGEGESDIEEDYGENDIFNEPTITKKTITGCFPKTSIGYYASSGPAEARSIPSGSNRLKCN